MKHVLFVCQGNSGRSIMAEALFNRIGKKAIAESAGWNQDAAIHPDTVILLKEIGIDKSGYVPRRLTQDMLKQASYIIVANQNALNHIPEQFRDRVENWNLPILSDKTIDQVRDIRDDIAKKVKELYTRI